MFFAVSKGVFKLCFVFVVCSLMPRVKRSRTPKPPAGFELVKPTLDELEKKMREGFLFFLRISFFFSFLCLAENDPHENKRKAESVWAILRIHHQQSRYIYDIFYRRKEISRELYDWLLEENYADRNLIAKWKKVRFQVSNFSFVKLTSSIFRKDMKNFAVYDVFKQKTTILGRLAFAVFQKTSSRVGRLSSVFTVGAMAVRVVTERHVLK